MNIFSALIAICCLAVVAKARPGYSHHGSERLEGIPDLESFGNIKYPKYDILGLGEYSEGHLPADEIHVTKHVTIKEPEPYPVKVPVPHPYPVPVPKPYPVVETKYVKVPHAVPYEIVKKVPVPIEVPKPYPVPVHQSGGGDSWHAGSGNVGQVESYGVHEQGNDVGNLVRLIRNLPKARPDYSHHGSERLEGIPDLEFFGNIKYPKYDILGLGEYSEGHLPADEIHVTKHVTIKEPEPYPVKVPVPHPYPVPIPKPYPVVETKYVKVPHAVPYEIVKKVPIPVEVPKPYPVPVHQSDSWHASSGNVGQVESYGVHEQGNDVGNLGEGDHISSYEAQGYGGGDQGGQGDWQASGQQEEGH